MTKAYSAPQASKCLELLASGHDTDYVAHTQGISKVELFDLIQAFGRTLGYYRDLSLNVHKKGPRNQPNTIDLRHKSDITTDMVRGLHTIPELEQMTWINRTTLVGWKFKAERMAEEIEDEDDPDEMRLEQLDKQIADLSAERDALVAVVLARQAYDNAKKALDTIRGEGVR